MVELRSARARRRRGGSMLQSTMKLIIDLIKNYTLSGPEQALAGQIAAAARRKDNKLLVKHLRALVALMPPGKPQYILAKFLAEGFYREKKYLLARNYYHMAAGGQPRCRRVWAGAASCALALGDYPGANNEITAGIKALHRDYRQYLRGVITDPKILIDIKTYYNLRGHCQHQRQNYSHAARDYRTALTNGIEGARTINDKILFGLGLAQSALGQTAAARESFAACLKINPSHRFAQEARTQLPRAQAEPLNSN